MKVKVKSARKSDGGGKRESRVALPPDQIHSTVEDVLATTQYIDMHTHLFPPSFGKLGLWGIDELLTYHYLEAEFFRFSNNDAGAVLVALEGGPGRRNLEGLFVENTPISEATRGIVAVLSAFDLPTDSTTSPRHVLFSRTSRWSSTSSKFSKWRALVHVVMTNDPLDPAEEIRSG